MSSNKSERTGIVTVEGRTTVPDKELSFVAVDEAMEEKVRQEHPSHGVRDMDMSYPDETNDDGNYVIYADVDLEVTVEVEDGCRAQDVLHALIDEVSTDGTRHIITKARLTQSEYEGE